MRDFHRSHKAQRINASPKPHEALLKTLLDQEPDPRPRGNDVETPGGARLDRAPDQVHAAPPYFIAVPPYSIEREAGQTVGMASVNRSADAARNTPVPVIERNGTPITRSLDALWLVMAVVVVVLGLIKFLFRRTYAKPAPVLAFGPPDDVLPVDSSWLPPNPVEANPGSASGLESVKKALDTIEEAVADMASSRQLPTP